MHVCVVINVCVCDVITALYCVMCVGVLVCSSLVTEFEPKYLAQASWNLLECLTPSNFHSKGSYWSGIFVQDQNQLSSLLGYFRHTHKTRTHNRTHTQPLSCIWTNMQHSPTNTNIYLPIQVEFLSVHTTVSHEQPQKDTFHYDHKTEIKYYYTSNHDICM